jgi:hypothetical protein
LFTGKREPQHHLRTFLTKRVTSFLLLLSLSSFHFYLSSFGFFFSIRIYILFSFFVIEDHCRHHRTSFTTLSLYIQFITMKLSSNYVGVIFMILVRLMLFSTISWAWAEPNSSFTRTPITSPSSSSLPLSNISNPYNRIQPMIWHQRFKKAINGPLMARTLAPLVQQPNACSSVGFTQKLTFYTRSNFDHPNQANDGTYYQLSFVVNLVANLSSSDPAYPISQTSEVFAVRHNSHNPVSSSGSNTSTSSSTSSSSSFETCYAPPQSYFSDLNASHTYTLADLELLQSPSNWSRILENLDLCFLEYPVHSNQFPPNTSSTLLI